MNIGELKELIQDLDDDVKVRLAHQPRWAFEYSVGGSALIDPANQCRIVVEHRPELGVWTVYDINHRKGIRSNDAKEFDTVKEAEEALVAWNERLKQEEVVFYLAEGQQIGYLPGNAANELGW